MKYSIKRKGWGYDGEKRERGSQEMKLMMRLTLLKSQRKWA